MDAIVDDDFIYICVRKCRESHFHIRPPGFRSDPPPPGYRGGLVLVLAASFTLLLCWLLVLSIPPASGAVLLPAGNVSADRTMLLSWFPASYRGKQCNVINFALVGANAPNPEPLSAWLYMRQ